MNSLVTKGYIGGGVTTTNYLPGGGTVSLDIEESFLLYIAGDRMDLIQKLNEWYVGDTVNFSGTVSGFPTGADPTDYTIKFDLALEKMIKQTLSTTLAANGSFTIAEELEAAVIAGNYEIYVSLWWSSSSSYEVKFDKKINSRPTA